MARDPPRSAASILVGRTTLTLFAVLAAGWFLPAVYPPLAATPLFIAPYLVVMVTYDGLFGLEHVAYAAAEMLPVAEGVAFDAGVVVTFYLFAVVAVALGGALKRWVGPAPTDAENTRTLGRFGYAVAAGLLVIGLLLAAQGAAAQPTVTSESCTGASAEGGSTMTATPTCTTTTEPATGQQRYIVSLGAGIAVLGAVIVGVDHWLAGR